MSVKEKFAKWAVAYSGCDGGDIGSPASPSVWVCGIEWGGEWISYEWLKEELESQPDLNPPDGYETEKSNIDYIYNINATKLLAGIDGLPVSEYEKFAMDIKPFVKGQKGYFKMNIYPLPFKDTSGDRWKLWMHELTGFSGKDEYLEWCRNNRFQFFRESLKKHKPKLIVCFGKSYKEDFMSAFCGDGVVIRNETISGRDLYWSMSGNTVVTVCPFPTSQHGLNSNNLIQDFGKRIREIVSNERCEP